MAIFTSYELNGQKLSFANWISNLSPVDTFFVSTTKKEMTKNKEFSWQVDLLAGPDLNNHHLESDDAVSVKLKSTTTKSNLTQILRKVVEVTDTADEIDTYGRKREMGYQLEKAGKEIKRDLEAILLSAQDKAVGAANTVPTVHDKANARKTACFEKLVAGTGIKQEGTDAEAYFDFSAGGAGGLSEENLFKATYNMFLAGSRANTIMFHPSHASFFSSLMETSAAGGQRFKMIDNLETKLNTFVSSLVDPLGQEYRLVPNRFMPKDKIYIFNPEDWTQMVLRAPEKTKLAKMGSSERYMIEMEIGLRHRDPFASAVLKVPNAPVVP